MYKAWDGLVFETKDECEKYETKIQYKRPIMINYNYQITTDLNEAHYVWLGNYDSAGAFIDLFPDNESEEVEDVYHPGLYRYDRDIGKFIRLESKLEEAKNIEEEMKYIKTLLQIGEAMNNESN